MSSCFCCHTVNPCIVEVSPWSQLNLSSHLSPVHAFLLVREWRSMIWKRKHRWISTSTGWYATYQMIIQEQKCESHDAGWAYHQSHLHLWNLVFPCRMSSLFCQHTKQRAEWEHWVSSAVVQMIDCGTGSLRGLFNFVPSMCSYVFAGPRQTLSTGDGNNGIRRCCFSKDMWVSFLLLHWIL